MADWQHRGNICQVKEYKTNQNNKWLGPFRLILWKIA